MDNSNALKKYLFDILNSIENIFTYIGKDKVFEKYDTDNMLQDAVERNIEIIGEATSNLLKLDAHIKITNSRRIVDARNKIIHGYDEIENTQVWNIIINHLPKLKSDVSKLLEEKDNE